MWYLVVLHFETDFRKNRAKSYFVTRCMLKEEELEIRSPNLGIRCGINQLESFSRPDLVNSLENTAYH